MPWEDPACHRDVVERDGQSLEKLQSPQCQEFNYLTSRLAILIRHSHETFTDSLLWVIITENSSLCGQEVTIYHIARVTQVSFCRGFLFAINLSWLPTHFESILAKWTIRLPHESTTHLCSAGLAGCWQVEGSCRIWPGGQAASRGWCSWSSSGTRQPGGSGRPCGSSPRRLPPERPFGGRRRTTARRGYGRGGEDGGAGREVGRVAGRAGEGRREGEGQTEGRMQTETSGQTEEPAVTAESLYTPCIHMNACTRTRLGQLCLTTTLPASGSLRGGERWVIEQGKTYESQRTWAPTHTPLVAVSQQTQCLLACTWFSSMTF